MEIYTIITTICIISYDITITCLICDENTHTLNFQSILHVVTVQVFPSQIKQVIQEILVLSPHVIYFGNLKYEYFHHKSNKLW